MPITVTCTCGLVQSVPGSRAGATVSCRCGRAFVVPRPDRDTPAPVTVAPERSAAQPAGTIHAIKRMVRTRELPPPGKCPHSGLPGDDVVVFRLHFDPVTERRLQAAASQASGGWRLLGWLGTGGRSAAARDEDGPRDVWVDMPLRVARSAHSEILVSTGQRHFRDMLRTVPIYATLLAEHPTARIEPLPRHSDGQPTHGQRR